MTEFEKFFELDFRKNLVYWFDISCGIEYPCQPDIALVRKGETEPVDPFFDKEQMSVAVMYACLIPQTVAKVSRSMEPLYAICKRADLPVFLCGLGGHCHPAVVLEDAGLYPVAADAPRWAEIAKGELEYFRAHVRSLIDGECLNAVEICEELGRQVNQISDAILSGGSLPTYLIEETEL